MLRLLLITLIFLTTNFVYGARSPYKSWSSTEKMASSGIELKKVRKVGVGLQVGGALGVMGAQLNLNFSPEITTSLGFGAGEGFKTFNLQLKQAIGGVRFIPYLTGGYARWFTGKNPSKNYLNSTPKFLAEKFLSTNEKINGFVKNLIYPGFGVEFIQPSGKYAGTSLAVELVMLLDLGSFNSAAVGSFAYSYYF